MSVATTSPLRGPGASTEPTTRGRGWAYGGVAAGVCGILAIGASLSVSAVYDEENLGNAEKIVASLKDSTGSLLAFHTFTMLACVTLLVFAAGLRRRLGEQTRAGSLLPDVAAAGLMLASVAGLMGSALDTEFISA